MKKTSCKRGFTLIELLVVVLIIGILAAVAVPQYKKVVYRSRYAQLKPLVQALANAEEVYYLANGKYTGDISELDVDLPEPPATSTKNAYGDGEYHFNWGYCSLNANLSPERVVCRNNQIGMTYGKILNHQTEYSTYAGMQRCAAGIDTLSNQICQQESGLSAPNPPDYPNSKDYYW